MIIKKFAPALLVPLAIVLSACGGDDAADKSPNDSQTASESAKSPESTPEPKPDTAPEVVGPVSLVQFSTDMQELGTALMSMGGTSSASDAVDEATEIARTARLVASGAEAGVEGLDAATTAPLADAASSTADKFDALAACGEEADADDTGACEDEAADALTALGELQTSMTLVMDAVG